MTPFSSGIMPEDSASKRSVALIDPKLLWDKAYDSLKEDDPELVKAYEKVLSCELLTPTTFPLSDIQQNRIEQKDTELRRSQMRQLVGRGLAKTEHEAKLKQGAGHVVDVALAANNTISTALKECPEAALAWTGVTFALQMIANPIKETETNRAGIDYVVRKMEWYWNLSSHLLKRRDLCGNSYAGLQFGLQDQIIHLYKALLSYQMKSVCSYYQNRGLVFLKDLVQLHDWDGQLHNIREAVTAVLESSKEYSTQQIVDFHEEETRTLQNIFHDLHHGLEKQAALQKDLQEKNENEKCLQDLRLTDPKDDMERIEGSKGRLLPESSTWILYHPSFTDWRHSETTRLLWMRADPGKGKTMLMISIIKELQSIPGSKALSFFFCQATDARLNNATAVLRGLIYKLVHQCPVLISHLHGEYDTAGSKLFEDSNAFIAVSRILHNMLRDPQLNQVYLVVDALDECQSELKQLLGFILESLSDPSAQVKWLVSSRHKFDIEKELSHEKSKTELNLEKDVEYEVSHAVKAYIDHKMRGLIAQYERAYGDIHNHKILAKLQNVENDVAEELHRKADSTFLWVALVFQQIEEHHYDAYQVLDFVRKTPAGLHDIYEKMMDRIIQQQDSYSFYCKEVLLIAVNSYRPLRLSEMVTLAALPELAFPRKVIQLCGLLSLREEDTVIYFVHQSAKDYLIEHAKPEIISQLFPVGYRKGHQSIFSRSLESMSQILRRDIYTLRHPGFCITDVNPLSPDPLAAIRYGCVYWADHLHELGAHSGIFLHDNGMVDAFLREHLLHWLEALSLIKSMSNSVSVIAKLVSLVTSLSRGSKLFELIHDVHRFILFNRGVIENAPLQVYYSALIFSPTHSLTRCLFQDEEPKWATAKSAIDSIWGACLQTLEGHSGMVNLVVFSSDGSRIASGSDDHTVRVWDANNGDCLHTLQGHSDWVRSVVFSSDGSRIASGSDDHTVRVWDANNGDCLHTLQGHSDWVRSVVFSSDGSRIASGSDDHTVRVWDANNGDCLHTLQGHGDWVRSVVFSSDGSRIASGSDDHTVRVWDANNGDCLHTLQGHSDWVRSVVFSSDGSRIASGSDDHTVRVWDANNGDCLHTLEASNVLDPATLGVIAWGATSITKKTCETPQHHTYGLDTSGTWITSNSQNVIWLPPEYRPRSLALTSSAMVIGCESGRVLIFDLSNKACL
ncbi:hypothetical protein SI65_06910 [Aspergillus cristatus]|uniref:NACHT domain-containing protein n=1 Tax=Aspergillus cristatus TaxID=573508 RepID=A0A1E3B8E6_ASPCR|nr:hypothetical protein SI65_06910 [Aspergillus cristatus]